MTFKHACVVLTEWKFTCSASSRWRLCTRFLLCNDDGVIHTVNLDSYLVEPCLQLLYAAAFELSYRNNVAGQKPPVPCGNELARLMNC
jgi:hypothetical protein